MQHAATAAWLVAAASRGSSEVECRRCVVLCCTHSCNSWQGCTGWEAYVWETALQHTSHCQLICPAVRQCYTCMRTHRQAPGRHAGMHRNKAEMCRYAVLWHTPALFLCMSAYLCEEPLYESVLSIHTPGNCNKLTKWSCHWNRSRVLHQNPKP